MPTIIVSHSFRIRQAIARGFEKYDYCCLQAAWPVPDQLGAMGTRPTCRHVPWQIERQMPVSAPGGSLPPARNQDAVVMPDGAWDCMFRPVGMRCTSTASPHTCTSELPPDLRFMLPTIFFKLMFPCLSGSFGMGNGKEIDRACKDGSTA